MIINDVPEIRRMFKWASVKGVELSYTMAGSDRTKDARELIVRSRG